MSEGDLRRPPRLPMQALSERISALTVGLPGSTVASLVPSDPLPAPGGTGSDPEPPAYAEIDTTTPGLPIVAQVIAGLAVTWTGLDTGSNPYPPGVYAEVHVSTTTGFTPSSSTLKGSLSRPGTFTVTGLTAGTGYFVRLVIVDEAGQTATSAQVGPVTAGFVTATAIGVGTITSDLVSFDATAIGGIQQYVGTATPPTTGAVGSTWVNTGNGSYNVLELVSGTKTWVQRQWSGGGIAPDSISTVQLAAGAVTAENILAQAITTKLVNGEVIRTSTDDTGARVRLTAVDGIEVYSSTERVFHAKPDGTVTVKGAITSGSTVTGATVTGSTIKTANSGKRVEISASGTNNGQIEFYNSGGTRKGYIEGDSSYVLIGAPDGLGIKGNIFGGRKIGSELSNPDAFIYWSGGAEFGITDAINTGLRVNLTGAVFSYGIDENTTTSAANVRVGASAQLLKSTSTVRVKDDVAALSDGLTGVPTDKVSADAPSVDPYDVLTITPTEFRSLSPADADARMLGFIAEDVAAKFPWAANWDDEGLASAVEDRPILAALLYVVREQQQTIADLTTRIEALEA